MFKTLESAAPGKRLVTAELLDQLRWNGDGLVAAIAQDHSSKAVLMLAWMNREALEETLRTGRVCYYSRSRQASGARGSSRAISSTSGKRASTAMGTRCSLLVDQSGPACHTGREHCFYLHLGQEQSEVTEPVMVDPSVLYGPKA